MKPISVTEIVSIATEVLIITDTPTARAGEEHTHTHTRAYTCMHAQTHCMKRNIQWIATNKDKPFTNLICMYISVYL